MIDYAFKQQNVWSRLAVIMILTAVEHNETIHYILHMCSDKIVWVLPSQKGTEIVESLVLTVSSSPYFQVLSSPLFLSFY